MLKYYDLETRKNLFMDERGTMDTAITAYYMEAYLEHLEQPPILREAYAQAFFWKHAPLIFSKYDLIVGAFGTREPAVFHYGNGTGINEDVVAGMEDKDGDLAQKLQIIKNHAYNKNDRTRFTDAENRAIDANTATSTFFLGHMVLDYETVLEQGLGGYLKDIAQYAEKNENPVFYEAMGVQLRAVMQFIGRLAEECSGRDLENGEELAKVLRHIQKQPPQTFWQALQLVWILHMLDNSDSFGRFDFYLNRFYQKDIDEGRLTRREAAALLVDFMIKIEQDGSIQNMTIGGVDPDGKEIYSPLTGMVLDVTRALAFKGPNLCLRVTDTMPQAVWDKALACIKTGIGLPALYNDAVYINSLTRSGIPLEDARNFCLAGCSQVMIPGRCNFMNDIGLMNVAKIAEITLYDGFDPKTGMQVGPHTGTEFSDFTALMQAFYKQLDYFCGLEASIHNKEVRYVAQREGYALRSLFMRDCLKNGRPVFEGGARYNNIELEVIGITNAADHFYAIKRAVFDEQKFSLSELRGLLRSNWENAAAQRDYMKDIVKFGNDSEGPDAIRAEISRFIYSRLNAKRTVLGGVFVPGEVIFVSHIGCGETVGATADGRMSGAPLADSAGAAGGCDQNGPTALLNSVLKIPASAYLLTSVVTNLKFLPEVFQGEKGEQAVEDLISVFFLQGGMQVQMNVFHSADLRDAQKHPENYRNLIVRVGGYSDYFVNLSTELQNEIINRNGHIL